MTDDAAKSVRVKLVCVHVANDGEETLELRFVDADGKTGTYLSVLPDGTMRIDDAE